jgi:hypothetical protein
MSDNKLVMLRRVLIIVGFFIAIFVFVLLFYFKFVPANKEELSQRGHRVLSQLIVDFDNKDRDIQDIVSNSSLNYLALLQKKVPYDQLDKNIPFDTVSQRNLQDKAFYPDTTQLPLVRQKDGDWRILFKGDSAFNVTYISIRVKDVTEQMLTVREDIFDDYLLLLDTSPLSNASTNNHINLEVICRKNSVYDLSGINADTLRFLDKNSDGSGIFDISVGGEKYMLFYQPFEFHNRRLAIGGLLSKEVYARKLTATPPYFFPIALIVVFLVIIALPFLKIYLLSPRESISSKDVVSAAASIFIGSAILSIIVFYVFFSVATEASLRYRLQRFSSSIKADLEREIGQADRQLQHYDSSIGSLDPKDSVKMKISNPEAARKGLLSQLVDSKAKPSIMSSPITRLFWVDTFGNTVAKWSPFTYPTPFTNEGRYDYLKILVTKPSYYSGIPGRDVPVLYPGKSNLTGEFQTILARYSVQSFYVPKQSDSGQKSNRRKNGPIRKSKTDTLPYFFDTARFIGMAILLQCNIQPVIPDGFGFSLIDNSGKVLIDGDMRRSLGENLFEESGDNGELLRAVRNQRSGISFNTELYGNPYMARVVPLSGQPLYLVTFFDRRAVLPNILRFLHFSYQTLILLWLLIIGCLCLSKYHTREPKILAFNLQKNDWIQPADDSEKARRGRSNLFIWLFVLLAAVLLFVVYELFFATNLDGLFFISLLLPFYVLAGARFLSTAGRLEKCAYISIGLINALMLFLLLPHHGQFAGAIFAPVCFQLLVLAGFGALRTRSFFSKYMGTGFYYPNLCFSILLISIIPTLGVLTYGFYAEKFQHKKQRIAGIASAFYKRSNYLLTELFPTYKVGVGPDSQTSEELVFGKSIYLTDNDSLREQPSYQKHPGCPKIIYPDGLYRLVLEEYYNAPKIWNDPLTIGDTAEDYSWYYQYIPDNQIVYNSGRPVGQPSKYIRIFSNLQKPQSDIAGLGGIIGLLSMVVMVIILIFSRRLVIGSIDRLFLMQMIKKDKIDRDNQWLPTRFSEAAMEDRTVYLKGLSVKKAYDPTLLYRELNVGDHSKNPTRYTQAEFILAMKDYYTPFYQTIWKKLDDMEKYILYDFCKDGYTNYKNSTILYKLISKRILRPQGNKLYTFSLSFREYILSLEEEGDVIECLTRKYNVPGLWASVRLPVFVALAVISAFLYLTAPAFGTLLISIGSLAGTATTLIGFWKSNAPPAEASKSPGAGS